MLVRDLKAGMCPSLNGVSLRLNESFSFSIESSLNTWNAQSFLPSAGVLGTSPDIYHFSYQSGGVRINEDTIHMTVSGGSFRDYSNPEITCVCFLNIFYIKVS